MSIFDKLSRNKDYKFLIENFNSAKPNIEQQELIDKYHTPNRSYIKPSARGISYEDVSLDTLRYIIETCYECSTDEKYQAILVIIYETYLMYKSDKNINIILAEAKEELIPFVLVPTKKKIVDLSFLNDATKDYDNNFFYVAQITIGANKILKYGFTNSKPRKRFSQIKSDIESKYNRQEIVIEPLLIIHCKDASKFEDEIKVILSENHIQATGYNFKGSSETFQIKNKDTIIDDIILPLACKNDGEVLYSLKGSSSGSHQSIIKKTDETMEGEEEKLDPLYLAKHVFD